MRPAPSATKRPRLVETRISTSHIPTRLKRARLRRHFVTPPTCAFDEIKPARAATFNHPAIGSANEGRKPGR